MKSLLIKDMYTLSRQIKIYALLVLLYAVLPLARSVMSGFGVIIASMMPITAMAYDERSKWNTLADMMPYTPMQLVACKYVLGYLAIAAAAVMSIVVHYAVAAFSPSYAVSVNGTDIYGFVVLFTALLASVILDLEIPLMFRYGVEKGRIIYYISIVLLMVVATSSIAALQGTPMHTGTLLAAAALIAVGAGFISIHMAVEAYRHKNG